MVLKTKFYLFFYYCLVLLGLSYVYIFIYFQFIREPIVFTKDNLLILAIDVEKKTLVELENTSKDLKNKLNNMTEDEREKLKQKNEKIESNMEKEKKAGDFNTILSAELRKVNEIKTKLENEEKRTIEENRKKAVLADIEDKKNKHGKNKK